MSFAPRTRSQRVPGMLSTFNSSTGDLSTISVTSSKSSLRRLSRRIDSTGSLSHVSFGAIEIQEYPIVLGDNPSTSCGPSVELDWKAMSKYTIDDLDLYESLKPPRRVMNQLSMPSQMRTKLLIENGYSMREIRETTANRNSFRRNSNLKNMKLASLSKLFGR